MTTNLELLEALDREESQLDYIVELALEQGIEIRQMYCLYTGKPIGLINESELEEALYEEGDQDNESLVDAMIVRTVASMRPSPALNKPDHGTIREMAARRPVDALAYLLNRLYGSKQLLTNRGDQWFAPLIARIETHRELRNQIDQSNYGAFIHWLLELDSKLNLHELTAPTFEQDRLGNWIVTKTGIPLARAIKFPGVLKAFESWTFALLHEWDKNDKAALSQLAWARGNHMTRSAFVRSYLDNPEIANRKRTEELKREASAKKAKIAAIGRPKSEKTRRNDALLASFFDIMGDVIDGKVSVAVTTPKKTKVVLGGMLFAKKESI